jgi:hypothetical protein
MTSHHHQGYGPDPANWIKFTDANTLRYFTGGGVPSNSEMGSVIGDTFGVGGETYQRFARVVDSYWGEHLVGARFEQWE